MNEPHAVHLRVRYAETDQMGVVYHANYLIYMEEGRTRLMDDLGCSYAELERRGVGLVVRKAELRFWKGARYDEEIVVRTSIGRVRTASVVFHYVIERSADGLRLASGQTELACLDLGGSERRPVPLPEDLRAVLLDPARGPARGLERA